MRRTLGVQQWTHTSHTNSVKLSRLKFRLDERDRPSHWSVMSEPWKLGEERKVYEKDVGGVASFPVVENRPRVRLFEPQ